MVGARCLVVLFALMGVAGWLVGAAPAGAQGLIIARPVPGPRPIPAPPPPQPLTIKAEKISLQVDSGAVRAQVSQVFQNPTSQQLEGTYLFNLPEGAAVSGPTSSSRFIAPRSAPSQGECRCRPARLLHIVPVAGRQTQGAHGAGV